MASPALKSSLRAIIAGIPSRKEVINISDAGLQILAKAYPNLAAISLYGACNLKTGALLAVLNDCAAIQAITVFSLIAF